MDKISHPKVFYKNCIFSKKSTTQSIEMEEEEEFCNQVPSITNEIFKSSRTVLFWQDQNHYELYSVNHFSLVIFEEKFDVPAIEGF